MIMYQSQNQYKLQGRKFCRYSLSQINYYAVKLTANLLWQNFELAYETTKALYSVVSDMC